MIKQIVTDVDELAIKSVPCVFTEMDVIHNKAIIQDMLDTAEANKDLCIGLAANQIGEHRRIILLQHPTTGEYMPMVNPVFTPVRTDGMKRYKEGCLSYPDRLHKNQHERRRFKKIKLTYQLVTGKKEYMVLTKLPGVIVQHEIDHLNGVVEV